MAYRRRESRVHRRAIFGKTADMTNLRNVKRCQPRGGRCL